MDWEQHVVSDPRHYRPAEADLLVGDPGRAGRVLGWKPSVTFRELVRIMLNADLEGVRQGEVHTPRVG